MRQQQLRWLSLLLVLFEPPLDALLPPLQRRRVDSGRRRLLLHLAQDITGLRDFDVERAILSFAAASSRLKRAISLFMSACSACELSFDVGQPAGCPLGRSRSLPAGSSGCARPRLPRAGPRARGAAERSRHGGPGTSCPMTWPRASCRASSSLATCSCVHCHQAFVSARVSSRGGTTRAQLVGLEDQARHSPGRTRVCLCCTTVCHRSLLWPVGSYHRKRGQEPGKEGGRLSWEAAYGALTQEGAGLPRGTGEAHCTAPVAGPSEQGHRGTRQGWRGDWQG